MQVITPDGESWNEKPNGIKENIVADQSSMPLFSKLLAILGILQVLWYRTTEKNFTYKLILSIIKIVKIRNTLFRRRAQVYPKCLYFWRNSAPRKKVWKCPKYKSIDEAPTITSCTGPKPCTNTHRQSCQPCDIQRWISLNYLARSVRLTNMMWKSNGIQKRNDRNEYTAGLLPDSSVKVKFENEVSWKLTEIALLRRFCTFGRCAL